MSIALSLRAREGCFDVTSLRELPANLVSQAFDQREGSFCLRPRHRETVLFLRQDIRSEAPSGQFDLVLCRNLAPTYFAPPLQRQVLATIMGRLAVYGVLVIGGHERLPLELPELSPLPEAPHTFQRGDESERRLGE